MHVAHMNIIIEEDAGSGYFMADTLINVESVHTKVVVSSPILEACTRITFSFPAHTVSFRQTTRLMNRLVHHPIHLHRNPPNNHAY